MILADTKFEFGLDERRRAGRSATRCSRPTPRATGRPRATRSGRAQPSFDKQYVRDWAAAQRLGQEAAGARDPRGRRRGHARALRRGLRAHHRRAVRRRGSTRDGARREGARADPPEGGHPRPAGRGRRARAARRSASTASATCTSAGWSSSTSRTPRSSSRCARSCSPTRSSRTTRSQLLDARRLTLSVKFGVLQFPGSCDEVDALARRARGSATRS